MEGRNVRECGGLHKEGKEEDSQGILTGAKRIQVLELEERRVCKSEPVSSYEKNVMSRNDNVSN